MKSTTNLELCRQALELLNKSNTAHVTGLSNAHVYGKAARDTVVKLEIDLVEAERYAAKYRAKESGGWSFAAAMAELLRGQKVYRQEWKSRGMYVFTYEWLFTESPPCMVLLNEEKERQFGWTPSQADMFANDWWVMA